VVHHATAMQKLAIPALLAAALAGGAALLTDALVLTDEERLDGFVDGLTRGGGEDRVASALSWSDPARVEVELVADGKVEVYGEGDEWALSDRAHEALAPLTTGDARVVSRDVEILGAEGRVAVRIETAGGPLDAQFRFARRGDGWLVTRLRVL
jgi:hypothetical protein